MKLYKQAQLLEPTWNYNFWAPDVKRAASVTLIALEGEQLDASSLDQLHTYMHSTDARIDIYFQEDGKRFSNWEPISLLSLLLLHRRRALIKHFCFKLLSYICFALQRMLLQHDSRNVHGCIQLCGGYGACSGCGPNVYCICSSKFYAVIFQVIKSVIYARIYWMCFLSSWCWVINHWIIFHL
jgi:hypothetical protein